MAYKIADRRRIAERISAEYAADKTAQQQQNATAQIKELGIFSSKRARPTLKQQCSLHADIICDAREQRHNVCK